MSAGLRSWVMVMFCWRGDSVRGGRRNGVSNHRLSTHYSDLWFSTTGSETEHVCVYTRWCWYKVLQVSTLLLPNSMLLDNR